MMSELEYTAPANIIEACKILKSSPSSMALAGGTDLLVNLRASKIKPTLIVDIKNIKTMRGIKKTKRGIEIGALTTMNELSTSRLIKGPYSLLASAASVMGCKEIRQRATLGGNIINASPGGESITPLTVLNAKVVIRSVNKTRTLSIRKFITWVNTTALQKGELLEKIILPKVGRSAKGSYMRRQRVKGMDLASVSCAVLVLYPKQSSRREIRISVGAVAPTPYRAQRAEKFLRTKVINKKTINKAAQIIVDDINPRASSLRASPEYKKLMIPSFLLSCFSEVLGDLDEA